jgi:hypothetical protein
MPDDKFFGQTASLSSPFERPIPVVVHAVTPLEATTRGIRCVSGAGVATLVWASGHESQEPLSAGDLLPCRVVQIKALTGLTAADLRAYA